jgi:uncharacterized protein YqeY
MSREYNPPPMTTVESRLKADIKTAMRAGSKDELVVLRTLMADGKNIAISSGADRSELPDDLMLKVLRRGVKTRAESVEMYAEAGRDDLVAKETFQIEIIRRYLPAEVAEAEIEQVVDGVIADLEAKDRKSIGPVMKEVLARLEGRADGKTVNRIVSARLA